MVVDAPAHDQTPETFRGGRDCLKLRFGHSLSAFSGVTGRAEIQVVRPGLLVGVSRPYLRTSLDGTPNDNLLRLPECSLLTQVLASLP